MPTAASTSRGTATRTNLGFLLAKASQRWNELLYEQFVARGFGEVRPAYGSILLPLFEQDGLQLVVDRKALPFVDGTEIDFERNGLNATFVFRNPNATGACGCGESFTVDAG